jgi:hypothetical protein
MFRISCCASFKTLASPDIRMAGRLIQFLRKQTIKWRPFPSGNPRRGFRAARDSSTATAPMPPFPPTGRRKLTRPPALVTPGPCGGLRYCSLSFCQTWTTAGWIRELESFVQDQGIMQGKGTKGAFFRFLFRQALAQDRHHPAGLESLPPCWWSTLVKLTLGFAQQHPISLWDCTKRRAALK